MKAQRFVKNLFFLSPLLLLAACSTIEVKNPAPLPQAVAPVPAKEYRIQVGDSLDIKFFYNPELNESVTVRPDGRIALQLVREIDAAGKTAAQLTDLLTEKYAPQIKTPEVAVMVRSFNAEKVFVDGEVNRSGLVALTPPMTALQAISQAGGVKQDSALLKSVVLIRKAASGTVTMTLNLDKALDGSDPAQDVALMPYDIVFVPRTAITNLDNWVDQYIRKALPLPASAGVFKSF